MGHSARMNYEHLVELLHVNKQAENNTGIGRKLYKACRVHEASAVGPCYTSKLVHLDTSLLKTFVVHLTKRHNKL